MGIKTDEIETMIDDCFRLETKMNEWEARFIQSISEQENLTTNQVAKLEAIWKRIT